MAAHRYWRLFITVNNGDSLTAVDELDLRASGGGSRLSVTGNGTATASSTYPGGGGNYAPSGAFDGVAFSTNPSPNAWFSNTTGTPWWLKWDFGAGNAQDINWMGLTNVPLAPNVVNAVKRAVLQWSDDDAAWTSHIFVNDHDVTAGATSIYTFDSSAGACDGGRLFVPFEMELPDRTMLPASMVLLADVEHGGAGVISGTVKIDGDPTDTPVRRRVVLLREPDAVAVRETWSDAVTGAYAFTGVNLAYRYTVLAYDHTHSYRAVVADNVTPD